MKLQANISLSNHSTMGLGGNAQYLSEISTKQELENAIGWAKEHELSTTMIGSGSNIIWQDEGFSGLVLVNNLLGLDVNESGPDYYVTIGSGEGWDRVVEQTCRQGLSGIESLSLIPGKAGATPIQNVGGYGQEIADTLVQLEAYDLQLAKFVTINNKDCHFGYRTSRFKQADKGRFYITSISLKLTRTRPKPPFYDSLASYLEQHHITDYSPMVIRQAVINIRNARLPDPNVVHNTGSFFANPVVPEVKLVNLNEHYSNVPNWPAGEGQVKLSAAWLIEQAGFKDYHDKQSGMATWKHQPLVLVNEHAKTTADLLGFKQKIVDAVQAKFGIKLIQEPELMPIG